MSRTEDDLRDALNELDRRAVEHGAPSTAGIVHSTAVRPLDHSRHESERRFPRWLAPMAAAAVVAAAGVTAAVLTTGNDDAATHRVPPAGNSRPPMSSTSSDAASSAARPPVPKRSAPPHVQVPPLPSRTGTSAPSTSASPASGPSTGAVAAGILQDAAGKLAAAKWTAPSPREFYYVRTNQATTWISVSGTRAGKARSNNGEPIFNGACRHGHLVGGESGPCTVDDVPHYLADAPTEPSAWNSYLEQIAPGARAAGAQGKSIVEVLHQDLTAPQAAAALLRYTESCPGLHLVKTKPVAGEGLTGVTCTSMSNGSYGLAFDASSHAFVGFVPVDYQSSEQDDVAEIVRQTAIVKAVGDKP